MYLEATVNLYHMDSSDVKPALRYSIISYVRRVVYDMAVNIWVRITRNNKYCSRRVDLRSNSIKISISIGGNFDEKRQQKQVSDLKQPLRTDEKKGIFHYAYQHPRAREENGLLDQNHIARHNENQVVRS